MGKGFVRPVWRRRRGERSGSPSSQGFPRLESKTGHETGSPPLYNLGMNPEELSHLVRKLDADVKKSARLAKVNFAFMLVIVALAGWFLLSRAPTRSQAVIGTSAQASPEYADDSDEKLLTEMHQVWQPTGSQSNFGPDPRLAPTVAILVRAVVALDRSSSRLTIVGLVLTVALFLQGLVPIWSTVKKWI
jgi:hypothetical protein